jgi:hypothetical protein
VTSPPATTAGPPAITPATGLADTAELARQDLEHGAGRHVWYIPDADLPWPDQYGPFEGHESLLIFNVSGRDADLLIDLYWTDAEPTLGLRACVGAQRIACLHPPYGSPADGGTAGGGTAEVPVRTQYAIRVRSSVPVICQYGRIECRPAFGMYTTMGWASG